MRVFLDANVLFSAAKSDGAVRTLVRMLLDARHMCFADEYVVVEARRNLAIKYPHALPELDALLTELQLAPMRAPAADMTLTDWLPEKDRAVLAAAIELQCDALVTGDRAHFGVAYGKTLGGVTVYSPALLAQRLLE